MIETTFSNPESIIFWSGVSIAIVLYAISVVMKAWVKVEEVRQKRKPEPPIIDPYAGSWITETTTPVYNDTEEKDK